MGLVVVFEVGDLLFQDFKKSMVDIVYHLLRLKYKCKEAWKSDKEAGRKIKIGID